MAAGAVDLFLTVVIGLDIRDGFPLGTSWSRFLLIAAAIHILWFSVLAAVLWVFSGFFPVSDQNGQS